MKRQRLVVLLSDLLAAIAFCSFAWCCADCRAGALPAAEDAQAILKTSGVKGGFVVHLGCGGGRLTAALRAGEAFTVHGLDADEQMVEQAQAYLHASGLYGPVSVDQLHGPHLPYADELINLLVVDQPSDVPKEEWMRVLVPGGVACVRGESGWEKIVKPWPEEIDHWSHFLHDASNNAVAADRRVGPPRRLQWVGPPLWLRSHETPSGVQACVFSGGRVFYVFDEGLIGITDQRLPDRWSLVCRDAFNGKLLWKRPLDSWGWRAWSRERYEGKDWTVLRAARTDVPDENQRRLVADGDRLYATLSYRAPLSILDAATGNVLQTVKETSDAREILAAEGMVVVFCAPRADEASERRGEASAGGNRLVAIDRSGRLRWQKPCEQIRTLNWAIHQGRLVYAAGSELVCLKLADGAQVWREPLPAGMPRTLVLADGAVVMMSGNSLAACKLDDGSLLWRKEKLPAIRGAEAADLFVIDGMVFRGMLSVNEQGQPAGKSPHVLLTGYDLRSGEAKQRIFVKNLRSPEHHHRCYRNRATTRYIISSYEGAEYLDLEGQTHCQNNWVRGACRYGMTPCYGMLFAPPDQCFCQPGGKLLGFVAMRPAPSKPLEPVADEKRLERGTAYGTTLDEHTAASVSDWPTLRHDPARSGSTSAAGPAEPATAWSRTLGGKLTQPVAVGQTVYVARSDAHTVYALDAADGRVRWRFTAGGPVDSPPTVYRGLVLFGSHDGYVYCLRATDGALVWRLLAAPVDRRVGAFDRIESAWPVCGSVLVYRGTAYVAAGRSTYLDGGIRLYGIEPASGRIVHRGLLEGPHRTIDGPRDLAFYILGANADVLVAQDGFIYMRQKKLTPQLKEIEAPVLSSKGAQDVGLHVFSTASLLDGSWYNRTFWMYAKRWPGFQLANQAPKAGQLLVFDPERTYSLRVFYRRNVHSPMFFPATKGYLLFADLNTNEPQIVGEPGARKPVEWLPQSDFSRAMGGQWRRLDSTAFGQDKMIGYTRAEPPLWMQWVPVRVRGMVKAASRLYAAGAPDVLDPQDPYAAFEGRKGARLMVLSAEHGKLESQQTELPAPPVFDGMIAAGGRLLVSLENGTLVALGTGRAAP